MNQCYYLSDAETVPIQFGGHIVGFHVAIYSLSLIPMQKGSGYKAITAYTMPMLISVLQ